MRTQSLENRISPEIYIKNTSFLCFSVRYYILYSKKKINFVTINNNVES